MVEILIRLIADLQIDFDVIRVLKRPLSPFAFDRAFRVLGRCTHRASHASRCVGKTRFRWLGGSSWFRSPDDLGGCTNIVLTC